ncbi:MAG: adenylate/guanylate cyclase domain-containing protein [Hyphomicrobiaceae bacterium]
MNRTTAILRDADRDAEGLLGIVRIVIAAALALVLALAVNAPSRPVSAVLDTQILLASAVITSYFVVGLATVIIVRSGRYRMWMAWVTAMLDVVLICANVWLSINNAGIPSLFALSFPSALMIPLILTFGALRFRPAIQITMTLLVGLLVGLTVASNPHVLAADQALLTHIKITFGLPPNLIRTVMIVAAGLVIALATLRSRRLLERIALEAEQRTNLTRFLPRGIATDMSDETLQRLRTGRAATLAIMFVDIRNFTRMAEREDPQTASQVLSAYRAHILDIVEAHGGIVDKFIGDGALILFGLDVPAATAARQSVDAATELLHRVDAWNRRRADAAQAAVSIGIGLHLGRVIVGAIGDERRLEFTVIGDEVNVASRVEQATKATHFALLATGAIIAHAGIDPQDSWENLGDTALRGRQAPVELWGYLAPSATAEPSPPERGAP